MTKGSQPTDGGYLLLSDKEKVNLITQEPEAKNWIRPFVGAEEFINNKPRWCLWLKGIKPNELKRLPMVLKRVEQVKTVRLASPKAETVKWASFPNLFTEDRQPQNKYLLRRNKHII